MKNGIIFPKSRIKCEAIELGESIEEKMRRVIENNEPIEDTAPLAYTDRKDGILPQYDIRTDRWELARKAMDKVNASIIASRDNKPDNKDVKNDTTKEQQIPSEINGMPVSPMGGEA